MATSFKGLHLCLPRHARPSHVRVRDAERGDLTLPLDACEARGGQPPWQSLPWEGATGPVPDDGDKHGPDISM